MSIHADQIYLFPSNLAIRASAGTGKTWTLAKTILHQLAGINSDEKKILPQQILAITFTEKAATEMKGRIRKEVRTLAEDPLNEATLNASAKKLFGKNVDLAEKLPKAEVWREIFSQLDRMTVSTYHSFAQGILMQYPVEAGLSLDVTLLDELGGQRLLNEVITDVLREVLASNTNLAKQTASLARRFGLTEKKWSNEVQKELAHLIHQLRQNGIAAKDTPVITHDAAIHYKQSAQQALLALKTLAGLYEDDSLRHYRGGKELLRLARRTKLLFAAFERQKEIPTLENHPRLLFPLLKQTFGALTANLFKLRRKALEPLKEAVSEITTALMQSMATTMRELAIKVEIELEERKRATRVMTFTDLILGLRKLLQEHVEVRASLQKRFSRIFIDEFQDTNQAQLDIVQLLAREINTNSWRERTLFIVGDPKQAIYSWRGARVDLFFYLFKELLENGAELGVLKTNYRSSKLIVEAGNLLFDKAMGDQFDPEHDKLGVFRNRSPHKPSCVTYSVYDQPPNQSSWRSSPKLDIATVIARIAFNWLYSDDPKRIAIKVSKKDERLFKKWAKHNGPDPYEGDFPSWFNREDADEKLKIEVLKNELGKIKTRLATPKDLTIIVRAGWQADKVSRALDVMGVPNVALVGTSFWTSVEISDLVFAVLALLDPTFDGALVAFLRSPLIGFSDDALSLLALREGPPLWDSLDIFAEYLDPNWAIKEDLEALATLDLVREKLLVGAHLFTPNDLLIKLIEYTEVRPVIAALKHGTRRLANMNQLVNLAQTATQQGISAWNWAWNAWNLIVSQTKQENAQIVSEADDVVRILTVHRSKGLEFPSSIVWAVDNNRNYNRNWAMLTQTGILVKPTKELAMPGYTSIVRPTINEIDEYEESLKKREQEEQLRLLYVAHTRAEDHLAYVGRVAIKKDQSASPKGWMFHLHETAKNNTKNKIENIILRDESDLEKYLPQNKAIATRQNQDILADLEKAKTRLQQIQTATPLPLSGHVIIGVSKFNNYLFPKKEVSQAEISKKEASQTEIQKKKSDSVSKNKSKEHEPKERLDSTLDGADFGTLVHFVLEHFDWNHSTSIEKTIKKAMRVIGVQTDDIYARVFAHVFRAVKHVQPLIQNAEIHKELPFLLHTGKKNNLTTAIRGEIDLLLLWPNKTPLLIDYKTGFKKKGILLQKDKAQLLAYATAVHSLLDPVPQKVRCRLLYTAAAEAKHVEVVFTQIEMQKWLDDANEIITAHL